MTDPPTISLASASTQTSSYISTSPPKRKRRPAGTPDPDAEVVALSPKTLLESDRYVCDICNQGFQRDQNLQMHRRRHKVPWKLLKRVDPEMRKRVYVCPEPSCLHHNPCHALGDLVGIKKHYRRKHSSMKQWECDKCSKAYAVQSDYKAHLKTCGTRGHCCDCGRVFSRVESFIEHQDTCAAARSKRGIASLHDHQKASVAATADADHSSVPNPIPSDKAEKVMKDSSYQHSATVLLASSQDRRVHPPLPHVQSASVPAVAINTHSCIIIPASPPPSPATSPAFLLPSTALQPLQSVIASAAAPAHLAASGCGSICTWETLQACTPPGDSTVLQNNKAELQLLPTKHHLNQLESSQSSVTWGKDIISTNSNTSAICSSPASHDKLACRGWPEVPEKSGAAISPCKLQLSIGLCHQDDQSTCCGNNVPLQNMSRPVAHQQKSSETFDPKPTDMQTWLAWSALSPAHQKNDAACHDEAGKRPPSSFTSHHEKQGMIMPITDAYQDAIHLELATTSSEHHCIPRPSSYSADHHNLTCSRIAAAQAAAGFTDQGSRKLDQSSQDTHDREMLKMLQVQYCKPSLATMEAPQLLRCSSSCGSIAVPETADDHLQEEPSNSTSGSIKEPDPASLLLETFMPAAAAVSAHAAADVLLQKATEMLKRASAEKMEAEKAWREARREREKAEEEAARAERISEYNKMIIEKAAKNESDQQKEAATRRASHSSTSSSPSSVANYSQASSSSLQMQELQHVGGAAGGHVVCTASAAVPSFITCPTCHHTQILYPSSNQMATLFLTSHVQQPTTLASTSTVPHN